VSPILKLVFLHKNLLTAIQVCEKGNVEIQLKIPLSSTVLWVVIIRNRVVGLGGGEDIVFEVLLGLTWPINTQKLSKLLGGFFETFSHTLGNLSKFFN
jgi:hypothetical protein